ncbi:MAG TPA: tRNA guanosine(15) transglycosylase TgtA [Nanoarchaeota archaeon]|nr:tRNA guanosine(15) transglycosylase TgtA [Nanoarchaeota archaeon]
MHFELISRDAGARICKIEHENKKLKTPNIAIVVNPNKMIISIKELKKAGVELIITNAYIISRSKFKEEIEKKKLHKFFGWENFIYTDSGTFQMFSQGVKEINNKEILEFQKRIGSDFITPVDVFTLPEDSYNVAEQKLIETMKRIEEASKFNEFVLPIQGGLHIELRKKACMFANKFTPRIFAIGGIVPLMNEYRYKELVDIILTCKLILRADVPVHAFGVGHPITFALLSCCGVDIFDSAMYSLAAQEGRYLTPYGTKHINELTEFPCCCKVCRKTDPEDVKTMPKHEKEKFLALHNLYVTMQELRTIRQAIHENSLWELVQIRARAHPKLLEALIFMLRKYRKFFMENDIFPKPRGIFYSGKETILRPEIVKAKKRLKHIQSNGEVITTKIFGNIPKDLFPAYPFLHFVSFDEFKEPEVDWEKYFTLLLEYQFGKGASSCIKNFELEFSKTGKPRFVKVEGKRIGTISAETGFFIPNIFGAELLKDYIKKIFVKKEAEEFVRKGRNVLAKFAFTKDKIYPGEEVAIFNENNELIATGKALLNYKEIKFFKRGVAVKVRYSLKKCESS